MKWRWIILISLAAGLLIGPWIKSIPGFVIIAIGETSIQTRLWQVIVMFILAIVLAIIMYHVFAGFFSSANRIRNWTGDRKWKKARARTIKGMIALAEGEWQKAEKLFVSAIAHSDTRLINYLAAAQAAQAQRAETRRDNYLKQALRVEPEAEVAVGLTQAQLQLNQGQLEQALATLTHLRGITPKHAHVVLLLSKLYIRLQDWQSYLELLPMLEKLSSLPEDKLRSQARDVWMKRLKQIATQEGLEALETYWLTLPKKYRQDKDLLVFFTGLLINKGAHLEAEKLIKQALKQHPSEQLVALYGLLEVDKPTDQLAYLESLQKNFEGNAIWLQTLGRVCLKQSLWGKAKNYLEQSLTLSRRAETLELLAHAYEALDDPSAANRCYREGIAMAVHGTD